MSIRSIKERNTAVVNDDVLKVAMLIQSGMDMSETDYNFDPAIYVAVKSNSLEVLHLLLDTGVDVDTPDGNGYTPLWVACDNRPSVAKTAVVETLLTRGANPNTKDKIFAATPLSTSLARANYEVFDLLLLYGADIDLPVHGFPSLLFSEVTDDDTEVMASLITRGAKVDIRDGKGRSLLLYCADVPDREGQINLLLKHGADVNAVDDNGDNFLMRAIIRNDASYVSLALQNGARTDTVNLKGETAVDKARNSTPEILSLICN